MRVCRSVAPEMTLAELSSADLRWRRMCLHGLPEEVQSTAVEEYDAIRSKPRGEFRAGELSQVGKANVFVHEMFQELRELPFELVESEAAIRQKAERLAAICERATSLETRRAIALGAGLSLPAVRGMEPAGEAARLACPRWWRRRLRHMLGSRAENGLRRFGHVRRGRAPYVSDFSLRRRREQRARNVAALESARLENGEGQHLELFPVVQASIANPRVRRTEFMVRVRGFETIADEVGHASLFLTLTAPSAFHPQLSRGGINPRFDPAAGGLVSQARDWLQCQWARVRAKLKRLLVNVYGFRIAEPHHDGTPHWHLLLFGTPSALEALWTVVVGHWFSDYADELTSQRARDARAKRIDIDRSKGSAAGYVAKYVAKNLDGTGIDTDLEAAVSGGEGAERVEAWASVHRIRQFAQIGGPPVGLWRELRRTRKPVESAAIELARAAADAGDWAGFMRACERAADLHVWKETTGEVNAYGEQRLAMPAGVACGRDRIRTRSGAWRIRWGIHDGRLVRAARERSVSSLGPVAITVRGRYQCLAQHPGHPGADCQPASVSPLHGPSMRRLQ